MICSENNTAPDYPDQTTHFQHSLMRSLNLRGFILALPKLKQNTKICPPPSTPNQLPFFAPFLSTALKKTKTAAQSLPPQLPFTHLDLNYFSTIWPCLSNLPKPLEPFPLFSAWKLYLVQDWFSHCLLHEAFPSQTAQGFCLCLITAFDLTVLVYLSVNIIHNSLKDRNSFLFTFLLPPSNPGPPK